jgi:hypothetical protein
VILNGIRAILEEFESIFGPVLHLFSVRRVSFAKSLDTMPLSKSLYYNTSAQPKLIHCWTNRYLTKCVVPLARAALSPLLISSFQTSKPRPRPRLHSEMNNKLKTRLTLLMQSPHNLYGSIPTPEDSDLV